MSMLRQGWGLQHSDGYNDLSELAVVFEIAVHFPHLIELKRAVDHGFERTTCKALEDVFHSCLPARLVPGYPPDGVPLDVRHLADHFQYRNRSVALAEGTVDVHDALLGQCRNEFWEVRPPDWVESNTCAVAVRNAHYFGTHILLVSCNDVSRPGLKQLLLLRGSTGQRDGGCAGIVGNLDCRQPNTAGSGRDDDEVTLGDLAIGDECAVGGYKHHPNR